MSKKRSDLDRLRNENRLLKRQLEQTDTTTGTPEIDQLTAIYQMAVWLADPLKATRYDTTRSPTHNWIATSGKTTTEGQPTYQARNNLNQLKRDINRLTRRWKDRLFDPAPTTRVDKPRCRHRQCAAYGRRQRLDAKYCYSCGGELKTKEDTNE